MKRRNFLQAGALCGGAAAGTAHGAEGNPSGVAGYQYRLPGFKEGSRVLFIGDSITDMKWGRNEKDRNH